MAKKFTRVSRALTPEQKQAYDKVRQEAKEAFPPLDSPHGPSEKGRIALAIREARKAKGLTFEQLARQAGMADAKTVRDIEYGSDAKMSDVTAVAAALGLRLELVVNRS
jgi:DNA-binding phage protein